MAPLLDIPRELFLMVCAHLTTQDLAKLTAVSRNTYVATQSVLYHSVALTNHKALVKFTRTLVKSPVVSKLTQR
jgi:cystathionine beta-lyase family protein involved in aluminum resistance